MVFILKNLNCLQFTFNVGMHQIWKDVEPDSVEMDQLRKEVSCIGAGLMVAPINFPGFFFHKALKVCFPEKFQSL